MGIKHKTPKASGQEGFATEWNDEHKIDSDVDFAGHSGVNVGEPISPSDIATKNYVDAHGGVQPLGNPHHHVGSVSTARCCLEEYREILVLHSYSGSGYITGIFVRNPYLNYINIYIDGNLFVQDSNITPPRVNYDLKEIDYRNIIRFENSFEIQVSAIETVQYSINYMTD